MPLMTKDPSFFPQTPSEGDGQGGGLWSQTMKTAKSQHDYLTLLLALLPEGELWDELRIPSFDPVTNKPRYDLQKLLFAIAQSFSEADSFGDELINEIDPRTSTALLPDWERVCGLPDDCLPGTAHGDEGRRQAVVMRLTNSGGQSIPFYLEIATSLEYLDVKIREFEPFTCESFCDQPLFDDRWLHVFEVDGASLKTTYFRVGSGRMGDRLAVYEGDELACHIRKLKPAHTYVIFTPDSVVEDGEFEYEATPWTTGPGWSIVNEKAVHNGAAGDLSQDCTALMDGKPYRVSFTVGDRTAGSVTVYVGGNELEAVTWNGEVERWIICGSTDTLLKFQADAAFDGYIDNVKVTPLS